jgi:predicted HTH domain antitoxin
VHAVSRYTILVAARWLLDEMAKLWEVHPERISQVLLTALKADPDIHWAVVVGAYLDEHISLAKAAELLGMDQWSLAEEFQQRGIPVRRGSVDVEEAKAEVAAWRHRIVSNTP